MDNGVYPILVVDDEPSVLSALKRELKSIAPVYTANTPSEALNILKSSTISVVISDYRMPEKDGVSFLSELKRTISYEPVKILLTAYSEAEIAIEAINRAGIYYFVRKPWVGAELETLVRRAMELFKTQNELSFYRKKMLDIYNIKKGITGLIAHELNTPMLLIKGYTELMLKEAQNNNLVKQSLDGLRQGVDRLEYFINEIVDIAKLEAGQYSVVQEEFDIANVVKGYFPDAIRGKKALLTANRSLVSSALKRASDYVSKLGIIKEEAQINGDFLIIKATCNPYSESIPQTQPELFFEVEPKGDLMNYSSSASNLELVYVAAAFKALGFSLNVMHEKDKTRVEMIISGVKEITL